MRQQASLGTFRLDSAPPAVLWPPPLGSSGAAAAVEEQQQAQQHHQLQSQLQQQRQELDRQRYLIEQQQALLQQQQLQLQMQRQQMRQSSSLNAPPGPATPGHPNTPALSRQSSAMAAARSCSPLRFRSVGAPVGTSSQGPLLPRSSSRDASPHPRASPFSGRTTLPPPTTRTPALVRSPSHDRIWSPAPANRGAAACVATTAAAAATPPSARPAVVCSVSPAPGISAAGTVPDAGHQIYPGLASAAAGCSAAVPTPMPLLPRAVITQVKSPRMVQPVFQPVPRDASAGLQSNSRGRLVQADSTASLVTRSASLPRAPSLERVPADMALPAGVAVVQGSGHYPGPPQVSGLQPPGGASVRATIGGAFVVGGGGGGSGSFVPMPSRQRSYSPMRQASVATLLPTAGSSYVPAVVMPAALAQLPPAEPAFPQAVPPSGAAQRVEPVAVPRLNLQESVVRPAATSEAQLPTAASSASTAPSLEENVEERKASNPVAVAVAAAVAEASAAAAHCVAVMDANRPCGREEGTCIFEPQRRRSSADGDTTSVTPAPASVTAACRSTKSSYRDMQSSPGLTNVSESPNMHSFVISQAATIGLLEVDGAMTFASPTAMQRCLQSECTLTADDKRSDPAKESAESQSRLRPPSHRSPRAGAENVPPVATTAAGVPETEDKDAISPLQPRRRGPPGNIRATSEKPPADKITTLSPDVAAALAAIKTKDIAELRSFRHPPAVACQVLEAVALLVGLPDTKWSSVRKNLDAGFLHRLSAVDATKLSSEKLQRLRGLLKMSTFSDGALTERCPPAAPLAAWCVALAPQLEGLPGTSPRPSRGEAPAERVGASDRTSSKPPSTARSETSQSTLAPQQPTPRTQQELGSYLPEAVGGVGSSSCSTSARKPEAPKLPKLQEEIQEALDAAAVAAVCMDAPLQVLPDLSQLTTEELVAVRSLTLYRAGIGSVTFNGKTDCRRLVHELRDLVALRPGEIVVYPDASRKPPVGCELNKGADVRLFGCLPKTQCLKDSKAQERYKQQVKKMTEDKGAEFVDYDCMKGIWHFRVQHF
eukprot:TRINITY_DN5948_c1_g1_i1.p1 TRINITY_DN5948_c1_g1~~TRINITY_DN5948_c1_g1_i1.p1  ORF type:complete len:1055 (+),score=266.28 TRINITY_DN5948_c1_g1_i1:125-3289(+)